MGTLIAIARARDVRGPLEELGEVEVTVDGGLALDRRGKVKGAQVTVLAKEDWDAACAEVGENLPWIARRANLLVEGVTLPQTVGARFRIGPVVLEVKHETDPCAQMDKAKPGLRAALGPDWRGGIRCDVVEGGRLSPGMTAEISGE